MFTKSANDEKEYFKNVLVPQFIKESKSVFKDKFLIGIIFYELFSPSNFRTSSVNLTFTDLKLAYDDATVIESFQGKPNCNCAVDSFFSCEWGQHDKKCRVDEQGDSCTEVTDCGFNWMFDCDGLCNPLITHQ